jgi:hypothetical protein
MKFKNDTKDRTQLQYMHIRILNATLHQNEKHFFERLSTASSSSGCLNQSRYGLLFILFAGK